MILDFAQLWHQYGGGDAEDIMVTFGVSEEVFYSRVLWLITSVPTDLDPAIAASIKAVSEKRCGLHRSQRGLRFVSRVAAASDHSLSDSH